MAHSEVVVDPLVCPLCNNKNACVNLSTADVDKTCWCNDPAIEFPEALRQQVPAEVKGKACICKACALAFQQITDA